MRCKFPANMLTGRGVRAYLEQGYRLDLPRPGFARQLARVIRFAIRRSI